MKLEIMPKCRKIQIRGTPNTGILYVVLPGIPSNYMESCSYNTKQEKQLVDIY